MARRMGQNKLLLPLGQKTIIEHVVDKVREAKVGEVILVLGPHREAITRVLAGRTFKTCYNPLYQQGQGTSVAAGAAAVSAESTGIMFIPGDQPLIKTSQLNLLIQEFNSKQPLVARPKSGGSPSIFSVKLRPELMKLAGDTGGRQLLEKYRQEVLYVDLGTGNMCFDIDTPEDYQEAIRLWQGGEMLDS